MTDDGGKTATWIWPGRGPRISGSDWCGISGLLLTARADVTLVITGLAGQRAWGAGTAGTQVQVKVIRPAIMPAATLAGQSKRCVMLPSLIRHFRPYGGPARSGKS
jgi:hypothetical protein